MSHWLPGGRMAPTRSLRLLTLLAAILALGAISVAVAAKITVRSHAGRIAPSVTPTPVPSCPTGTGTDTWTGGATGTWEGGSWSAGAPTSSSYVCIPGGDTVTLNTTTTIDGLLLESGAALEVQSNGLTISGTSAPADSALQGSLQVSSGAGVAVGADATLLNAAGGTITNQGTIAVAGDFEQDAGTVATGSGDDPVELNDGSSMVFAGTGAGAFQVTDGSASTIAVALSGDIAADQSLEIQSPASNNSLTTVTAASSFTNAGTITFDHNSAGGETSSELAIPTGDTLTNLNDGTIDAIGSADGSHPNEWNENIDGDVDNEGTLNVGVAGQPYADLVFAAGSTLTNDGGSINVLSNAASSNSSSGTSALIIAAATTGGGAEPAAVLDNNSGTLDNAGTVSVSGTFTQGDATVSTAAGDNPIQLLNGSSINFAGSGPGAFQISDPSGTAMAESLSGNIAAGQSLEIQASQVAYGTTASDVVTAAGSFTNAGTITFDHAGAGGEDSVELALPSGDTVTNTGAIKVEGSPAGSYAGQWNERIDGNVDNYGVLDVGISGQPYADLVLISGSRLTNDGGSINVLSNAASSDSSTGTSTLNVSAATTGGGAEPAAAIDNEGGTITNHGQIIDSGGFTQDQGTVATGAGDYPVQLTNGSSLAFTGPGAGAFQVTDPSVNPINVSLSGDVAADQSLEIQAPQSGNSSSLTTVTAAASFTNAGTITLDHPSQDGETSTELAVPPGGTLTNTGTIDAEGSGAGSHPNEWNEYLGGHVDNEGTLNVGVSGDPYAVLQLAPGSTLSNNGGAINVLSTAASSNSGGGPSELISDTAGITQTSGTTNLGAGATIDVSASSSGYALSGGTLAGIGEVTGSLDQSGGTLAPGATGTPGTITVSGAYTQGADGTLAIPINGTASSDYSVLAVGGNATLAGGLSLQPSDSYRSSAQIGDSDPVFTFGGTLIGNFASAGVAPQNTALPQITGSTAAGDVLTCVPGSFSDNPTSLSYQWNRNGAAIGGATSTSYTIKTADVGTSLSCTETASGGAALSGGNGFSAVAGAGVIDAVVGSTYSSGSTAATSAGTAIPVPNTSTPAVTIPTTSVPDATDHESYGAALTACGGTAPSCQVYSPSAGTLVDSSGTAVPTAQQFTFSRTSGTLPTGLSLSSQGYLFGTPTQSGSFQFTVVATDPADDSSSAASFTLTIGSAPAVTVSPATLPAAVGANAYNESLTACGGTAPSCETYSPSSGTLLGSAGAPVAAAQQFTFAIASGGLPPGITLSSEGYLSGTPTQTGSYEFSVVATDASADPSAPASYTLTVNPGISITEGSVYIGGALAAGAATVTPGSSGGINAVSIDGGSSSSLTTLNGSGVPSGADQIGLQIGHDQSGDCETELELGNAQGLVFNAANLDITGCDSAPASSESASTRRASESASTRRGHTDGSLDPAARIASGRTAQPRTSSQLIANPLITQSAAQTAVAAASDCSTSFDGQIYTFTNANDGAGGSCSITSTGSGAFRISVTGGTMTAELDGSTQSTGSQLTALVDAAASIPPVMQITPLTTFVDSYATGLASSGAPLTTAHQTANAALMAAYGFSTPTTAEQTVPSFAASATGAQSELLSELGALESQNSTLGLTDRTSLVSALASEISDGDFGGPVSEQLGSGTLPATAGTSEFQTGVTAFSSSYSSSIPSLAPAGTTIKEALPVMPMPVTLPIVVAPTPVGSIQKIGTGAFTETVTASSPTLSAAPFPTSGGATFTIEVVS